MSSYTWGDLVHAAAEAGFILIPGGTYDLEIIKAEAAQTNGRKDKIVCRFKVLSGPEAGGVFSEDFVISPESAGAMGFFLRKMAAFGLSPDYFQALGPISQASLAQVAAELVGRQATGEVTVDTSYFEDGKNKLGKLYKIGSAPPAVARFTADTPLPGNDVFSMPVPPEVPAPAQDALPEVPPPPPLPAAF